MRRRTLSILVISLASVVALVVAALAAVPPPNLGRALEAQQRLVAERPQDPAAFNDLGNLFLLAHQTEEAEQAYRHAVSLDPKRVSALFNLGLLLQQRGELKQALGFYRQVLEAQPEHAWAHYQAGTIYESRGETSKAVNAYASAFSLDPQLAFAEVNPHIVDNKLVTQAMLQAYRQGYGVPQVPAVYEDPHRIANLLVPPPQTTADTAGKDATATKTQPVPAAPGATRTPPAQPGGVIRERDLDTRVTGQATPQGGGAGGMGASGSARGRMQPNTRLPTNVPRGTQQWQRPEPTVQYPVEEAQPPVPAPGQVITPPPGGVYYRPGIQSTGRLNLQVVPEKRVARG